MKMSKINHEQQIQVVIRLKPHIDQHSTQNHYNKCVYTSNHEQNQLIVETQNKKEYFVFDNVANEDCTQQGIYQQIGRQVLLSSIGGFNCCIFAYGQTGAGKTYSILGKTTDLNNDIYAQTRGVLPRLLNQLFDRVRFQTENATVNCSYMEIYNEQIFDLLNTDIKVRQIREDLRRGVYVDGLSEQRAECYPEAIQILLRGQKNRRIGATAMNAQSSRSHTIFTINLDFDIADKDQQDNTMLKHRRAKINIVDLAGSQRAKQAKVEGQRLKQGCNINKSLHVLGNVINALVESTKKKKHIPFRDSKLTHFLKDSLSGNSVTKLLANIDPNKKHLSDTLSTLMFAKRAKIIRMKVEANQNLVGSENFDVLRKQIRQLRQQLAEARYIKDNESKISLPQDKNSMDVDQDILSTNWDKIVDTSGFDYAKNQKIIQVLEENETNYKALIQIYEEHMKNCSHSHQSPVGSGKKTLAIHNERKNLQKKNEVLMDLVKNVPSFTKIFKENLLLKSDIQKEQRLRQPLSKTIYFSDNRSLDFRKLETITVKESPLEDQNNDDQKVSRQIFQEMADNYEHLLEEVQSKLKDKLQSLENCYEDLVRQSLEKDAKIKELKKRRQYQPEIQALINQNQYLKLNILELESEVNQYQENQNNSKDRKNSKSNSARQIQEKQPIQQYSLDHEELPNIVISLEDIKKQILEDVEQFDKEKQEVETIIALLKQELLRVSSQNQRIVQSNQSYKSSNIELQQKMSQLLKISSVTEISKDKEILNNNTNTFWTIEEWSEDPINLTEHGDIQTPDRKGAQDKNKLLALLEREEQKRVRLDKRLEESQGKSLQLSNQIIKIELEYKSQLSELKKQIRRYQSQMKECSVRLQAMKIEHCLIEQQFGKPLSEVIGLYRQTSRQSQLPKHEDRQKTQRNVQKIFQTTTREETVLKSSVFSTRKQTKNKEKEKTTGQRKHEKVGNNEKVTK